MRGRKPLPTSVKLLNGNPGRRALNMNEPQPRLEVPECPDHLDSLAREEWDRVSIELEAIGVLSVVDRAMLSAYCVAWSRWVKAERYLAQHELVLTGDGGGYYQNPMLAVANKALDQVSKFAAEFGLTPSSRTRIKANPAEAKASATVLDFVANRGA